MRRRLNLTVTFLALLIAAILGCRVVAVEPSSIKEKPSAAEGSLNLATKTLGGKQLWNDEFVFHDYRIQRNVLTGHFRLLDGEDVRRAWGSREHCEQTLDAERRELDLKPLKGRVVILLHGLGRARSSMAGLADYLKKEGGLNVVSIGYASTLADIHEHAERLAEIISEMPEVERIDFVAHSMGNIVIRRFLARQAEPETRRPNAVEFGRFVMLCPPNHGALAAERLAPLGTVQYVGCPALSQLGKDWKQLEPQLATPPFEFGVLAGGRGDDEGYISLIPGDDDLVISVATTRLAGARDFRVVQAPHTFFADEPKVQQYTLRFLEHGYFESDETRDPIAALPNVEAAEDGAKPPIAENE